MVQDYEVISPDRLYKGKTYGDLAADWFNWFLSADSDNHTLGPVVFLRSKGMPRSKSGHGGSGTESDAGRPDDPHYSNVDEGHFLKYINEPNVKVGADRLQIYRDQAIFVPIIVAYAEASKPYDDWGTMHEYTGLTIDNGDNPPKPEQITIDGEQLKIDGNLIDVEDFRITSPVFPAVIADTAYGRSVKDFLEMPLAPGSYPTIVDGYFVLLRFKKAGTYVVHSYASAGREIRGPYFSQLLYQVEVQNRPEVDITQDARGFHDLSVNKHRGVPGFPIARDEKIISDIIIEKLRNGELRKDDVDKIGTTLAKIINFDIVKNYRDFIGETRAGDGDGKSVFPIGNEKSPRRRPRRRPRSRSR